jgi:hypothetical protein
VVFGSAGVRQRGYQRSGTEIVAACRALKIASIADVGPGQVAPSHIAGIPVQSMGVLPAHEIEALLHGSLAGFISYPPDFLGKSTIFAAYCALGLVPVDAWPGDGATRPEAPPCWRPAISSPPADWQSLADRAHAWYCDHALDRHTSTYAALLQ